MTIKDYPELEAFVAEAIEANLYNRFEIAARNLLDAMQAVGVVSVHEEATEAMVEAFRKVERYSVGQDKDKINAAIAASSLRRKE